MTVVSGGQVPCARPIGKPADETGSPLVDSGSVVSALLQTRLETAANHRRHRHPLLLRASPKPAGLLVGELDLGSDHENPHMKGVITA